LNGDSYPSYCDSIRKRVFAELDKNPLLTAKPLCKLLGLDYQVHGQYLKSLKTQWKWNHQDERGSNGCLPDDVHNVYFVGLLPRAVVRIGVELKGWIASKSRNRFLLWKERLGRVRWFETGTVELYVRKPANLGKAMQLFCNAFVNTEVIQDYGLIDLFKGTLRIRGGHSLFSTPSRLPYKKITLFKGTNGITVITGDRSHPNAVEIIFEYQDQVRRVDELLNGLSGLNESKRVGSEGGFMIV
jgi:hypothetical protein